MRKVKIKIGRVLIGQGEKIVIQSMTNTITKDVQATIKQIKKLEKAGCEMVRVAVLDEKDALSLSKIKAQIKIPLIADIHFDYRLALLAIQNKADKIRINPGNIKTENLKKIIELAKDKSIPIRIGINSGSLHKEVLAKFKKPTAEALVFSALKTIRLLEAMDFKNMVISLKHSDVLQMVEAYRLIFKKIPYPLHLGLTEAGTLLSGSVKSAVALGILLYQGIGDTIRISLSADPVYEILIAKKILQALNLSANSQKIVEVISCPTCGRSCIDVIKLAQIVEKNTNKLNKNLKIAIMGCLVNGPGEAKQADLGLCGINQKSKDYMFFKKGKIVKKIKQKEGLRELLKAVKKF